MLMDLTDSLHGLVMPQDSLIWLYRHERLNRHFQEPKVLGPEPSKIGCDTQDIPTWCAWDARDLKILRNQFTVPMLLTAVCMYQALVRNALLKLKMPC